MINPPNAQHRSMLQSIAYRAMLDRGLLPDFSQPALAELDKIKTAAIRPDGAIRDLRNLAWCSIDNDDSRDLDQLTVAEEKEGGAIKVLVAIADVDSIVRKNSAIDDHARHNTCSVYTAAQIFPMLPEKLSNDLTSLNFGADRRAIVIEMVFADDGTLTGSDLYRGIVRNQAKLAYNGVAGWLEKGGPAPPEIAAVDGLAENIRLQDRIAQKLKTLRHVNGALEFETLETRPVFDGNALKGLETEKTNKAKGIIEDFMIAANGVTARFLASKQAPSIRRVVRTPKRWDRIVELAAQHNVKLPSGPDSKALEEFLTKAKAADPDRFPDLSLSVIKLLGPGEYVVELPGNVASGHFGLAVKDYAHSTAPNRRFPDIITQRLLKAAIDGQSSSYAADELEALAKHCTEMEDAAKKVERQLVKSAAAMLLEPRIGEQFDAIVTGASAKGTWVRIFDPPVEGKLMNGSKGLDVGVRLRVQLVSTNAERGFIDFAKENF
jgi:VacB/RNase II family 3'-5' exoribonuclease